MIWVLDASVALRWFLKNEKHSHADAVLKRIVTHPVEFAVPELFGFEVFAVLSRCHSNAESAYLEGLLPILHSGVHRCPMSAQLVKAAQPFIRAGLTGYDACYAALADMLQGKWLTFDQKAHARLFKFSVSIDLSIDLPDWDKPQSDKTR